MASIASSLKGLFEGLSSCVQVASHQWKLLLLPTALAYLCLVSSLRYKHMRNMHKRFPYPTRKSLSKMTVEDAFAIHNYLIQLEFPTIFNAATSFALFKVDFDSLSAYIFTPDEHYVADFLLRNF